jgi:AICAR transformylase/IMP cyclohydrolase PurH
MNWRLLNKNYKNFKIWVQPETDKFYATHLKLEDEIIETDSYEDLLKRVDNFQGEYQKRVSNWAQEFLKRLREEV